MTTRTRRPVMYALLMAAVAAPLQAQDRPSVQPKDYGQWESLGTGTLSPNGEWLAVPITRVNRENELRIHQTNSDSVIVVAYGAQPTFSEDGQWVAYSIGKSEEETEQIEEDGEDVRNDLGLVNLVSGEQSSVAQVQSFAFGGGGTHLAMARYASAGTRAVVVRGLATGDRVSFGSVASWAWQDDGPLLAFMVHGADGVGNGVQIYDASAGRVSSLDSSESEYAQLTWRDDSSDLAILREFEDEGHEEEGRVLLAWRDLAGSAASFELDPSGQEAIGVDERIVAFRSLQWAEDGGSIFFDEIGNIGLDVQAKLLRVIQEKEFMRLGSVDTVKVDVRLIAATNDDLKKMIGEATFREDLYYRINVISLTLPPLRNKVDDIPLLSQYFLDKYGSENGRENLRISEEALELLKGHSWPGNVRELENAIERAVVLAPPSGDIGGELIREYIEPVTFDPSRPSMTVPPDGLPMKDVVQEFQKQLIIDALRKTGWVQKEAARLLGVKPTTLNEMIKRHGIRESDLS